LLGKELRFSVSKEHIMDPSVFVCRVFHRIVTTMPLDTIAAFDAVVAFVIPLLALLTSSPVIWRQEHLWNFSVLQRVHLSNLF
jgi:hypothetical protein